MAYTIVLSLALLVTVISGSKPINLAILVAMTTIACCYAIMIRCRELRREQQLAEANIKVNAYTVENDCLTRQTLI